MATKRKTPGGGRRSPAAGARRGAPARGRKGSGRGGAERRLLAVAARLLSDAEPVTFAQLQAEFPGDYGGRPDAAEKRWTRDKEALQALGFAVRFVEVLDERGAYTIDPTSCYLPRLDLTPEESAVIWLAGQAALRTAHPLRDDLETALRKLVAGTGVPPRAFQPELEPADGGGPFRARLDLVADACARRKRIWMRYASTYRGHTERQVDPWGYAYRRGEWIFVGWCHDRRSPRIFYLRRVLEMRLDPRRAKGPDFEVPAGFDVRVWSRQEPWDWRFHEPARAVVRFRGSLARIAARLLRGAEVTAEGEGACRAALTVRNLEGLVRQVLAWGPEAEIVEPDEGRVIAREMLRKLRPVRAAARQEAVR